MAIVRDRRLPQLSLTLDLPPRDSAKLAGEDRCIHCPFPPPTSTEYQLSDFERIGILGSGNGGTVYKVRHRHTAAVYALKLLLPASATDPSIRRYPSREADIHLRADHPSVVRCHAVLATPTGDAALLLEYMDGGSMHSLLHCRRAGAPLPESALASVARRALSGLDYLHSRNVAHRDVKPGNLLINGGGEVKIADFGVSKVVRRALDTCPSYVGTCAYMSPERFDPEAHGWALDAYAGDVWGLGLTLMELRLGRFPLLPAGRRADWTALMWAICFGDPPALPPESDASAEFRDFVAQCLQREPGRRWSAFQLLAHPFVAGADADESDRAFLDLLA